MATPHKCPVCDGTGQRHREYGGANLVMYWIDCSACKGSGIVWDRGNLEFVDLPILTDDIQSED